MNDDQIFLANAYLDGELTTEERGIAEADPDVMSEVEQLRVLQADLRRVEPPLEATRESAISAAMAEFGEHTTPASVATPTTYGTPIPFRPRPAYAKYLGVAAALLAVVGLGVVVSQSGLGGDDDDASSAAFDAEPASEDLRVIEALPNATILTADGADTDTASTEMAADDAGGDAGAEAGAEAGAVAEDAGEDTAEMAAEEASGDVALGAPPASRVIVPPDFDPDEPITDELELGVYGAYLLALRDTDDLRATSSIPCDGDFSILHEATFLFDDVVTPVYIAVQESEDRVLAVSIETCEPLVTGSLS